MTHFTDLELHRWRESGPGNDRDRVVEHLAACADCSARYAAAIRARPLRAEEAADVRDFVAAGYRVPAGRRWVALLAAAAAVLIVAIAIPLTMHRSEPAPEMRFRGSGIQALSPDGPADSNDLRFVWSSGIAAARYRIEVSDAKGVILTTDATRSPLALPAQFRGLLHPDEEYRWSVTALDDHGRPLLTSSRTFTIRK